MDTSTVQKWASSPASMFGIIPCVIGVGIGQVLVWGNAVWLSDSWGFWPVTCTVLSLAALGKRAYAPFEEKTSAVAAFLLLAWTWAYAPLWATAIAIPQSSAVVSRDGRIFVANEWARFPEDRVWLLTRRVGKRIIGGAAGTAAVNGIDIKYRFSDPFIAATSNNTDLAKPVLAAVTTALAAESAKPRASRIDLFEKREVHDRFLGQLCRAIVPDSATCPLQLSLKPRDDQTALGTVWSKHYTEHEAVAEPHLPTLVRLLTGENPGPIAEKRVFERFLDLADTAGKLASVARKPRHLDEHQLDELIRRILDSPDGGNEAAAILLEVNRLKHEQRQELRAKLLAEASAHVILAHAWPLHISDAEIALLGPRLDEAFAGRPEVAVQAVQVLGERLPATARQSAVRAIVAGKVAHALAAIRHVHVSTELRTLLLQKILAEADIADFEAAQRTAGRLDDMLMPAELRALSSVVIAKSETSTVWHEFAARALPVHTLSLTERKSVLNGILFKSAKSALEFVSENRQYLDAADVNEVTTDYTRTITRDFCLHLSHRNANRGMEYFSEEQLRIFRDCAKPK